MQLACKSELDGDCVYGCGSDLLHTCTCRSDDLNAYEQMYWNITANSTGVAYDLNRSVKPWNYTQCAIADSQFFWAGNRPAVHASAASASVSATSAASASASAESTHLLHVAVHHCISTHFTPTQSLLLAPPKGISCGDSCWLSISGRV